MVPHVRAAVRVFGRQIECTSRFGIQETLDTLDAMFPVDQPSIDTILIESRAEVGE